MIISNDAFFYITRNEAMLDETNMEEVDELNSMFDSGFTIVKFTLLKNDEVEIEIEPVQKEDIKWTGHTMITKFVSFKFIQTSAASCNAVLCDAYHKRTVDLGECRITRIKNKPWAITPNGSQIPLFGNGFNVYD